MSCARVSAGGAASSSASAHDDDDCEILGARTGDDACDERNAEGFKNAIDLDED